MTWFISPGAVCLLHTAHFFVQFQFPQRPWQVVQGREQSAADKSPFKAMEHAAEQFKNSYGKGREGYSQPVSCHAKLRFKSPQ